MMEQFSIAVENLYNGKELLSQQTITIRDGRILKIANTEDQNNKVLAGTLYPGFIDVQVNGGGGYLFNQSPNIDSLKLIGQAHQQFGTTGWLPTLITDNLSQMQRAADAVAEAIDAREPGILGIHFEGPHLSTAKKGVHSDEFIRELTRDERELYVRSDIGKVVVTLAPENVSPTIIAELVSEGVIVSLGHSNATFEQTQRALEAGASGFTHLHNAMSPLTSREPGMVGAAMLSKSSYAGLILDGIHVHPQTAKLAIQTMPNTMLVTDAMPPVGSKMDNFDFFGLPVTRQGDTLRDRAGRLAGSVLNMAMAFKNCSELLELDMETAINLVSLNPARFLGIEHLYGSLSVGKKASMVLVDALDNVVANWIDGNRVYTAYETK